MESSRWGTASTLRVASQTCAGPEMLSRRFRLADGGQIPGHLAVQESFAMVRISEVHLEVVPGSVLQHAHIPRARNRIRELPDDMEAFFFGEPCVVGLQDR